MAYLAKHSTLDPVMVSVVSSNPPGGNFLKIFKPLDVNFGLKCKYDLIVKNSNLRTKVADPTSFKEEGVDCVGADCVGADCVGADCGGGGLRCVVTENL